jgi:hypothetical protein
VSVVLDLVWKRRRPVTATGDVRSSEPPMPSRPDAGD